LRCCNAREQRSAGYIVAALVPSDSGRCRPHIERVFARGLVAHSRTFFKPASSNTTLLTLRIGGPANCAHTLRVSEHMPLMPGGSLLCGPRVVGVRFSASKRVTLSIDETIPGPQTGPPRQRAPQLPSGPAGCGGVAGGCGGLRGAAGGCGGLRGAAGGCGASICSRRAPRQYAPARRCGLGATWLRNRPQGIIRTTNQWRGRCRERALTSLAHI
jgi:hypothetical protein